MAETSLGDLKFTFKMEGDKAVITGLDGMSVAFDTTGKKAKGSGLLDFMGKIGLAGMALQQGVGLITQYVAPLMNLAGSLEQNRIAFTTMTGSAANADKILQKVADFAAATPFEMPELVGATKNLIAFGMTGDDAFNTMKTLGDIAAGTGANIGELSFAMGQIATKGKADTENLNRFAERGIPIYKTLAEQLGVSGAVLQKEFIEKGKIGLPQVQAALTKLTSEGGQFFGMMANQSKSFTGMMSTLKDNLTTVAMKMLGVDMTGKIDKDGIFAQGTRSLQKLLKFLDDHKDDIINFVQKTVDFIKAALLPISGIILIIKVSLIETSVATMGLGTAIGKLPAQFAKAATAAKAFVASLGPVAIAAIALGAAGTGIAMLADKNAKKTAEEQARIDAQTGRNSMLATAKALQDIKTALDKDYVKIIDEGYIKSSKNAQLLEQTAGNVLKKLYEINDAAGQSDYLKTQIDYYMKLVSGIDARTTAEKAANDAAIVATDNLGARLDAISEKLKQYGIDFKKSTDQTKWNEDLQKASEIIDEKIMPGLIAGHKTMAAIGYEASMLNATLGRTDVLASRTKLGNKPIDIGKLGGGGGVGTYDLRRPHALMGENGPFITDEQLERLRAIKEQTDAVKQAALDAQDTFLQNFSTLTAPVQEFMKGIIMDIHNIKNLALNMLNSILAKLADVAVNVGFMALGALLTGGWGTIGSFGGAIKSAFGLKREMGGGTTGGGGLQRQAGNTIFNIQNVMGTTNESLNNMATQLEYVTKLRGARG